MTPARRGYTSRMTSTAKVFVAALIACALIALLGWQDRNWVNYAIGSVIVAGLTAGAYALLRRLGGRSRTAAPH